MRCSLAFVVSFAVALTAIQPCAAQLTVPKPLEIGTVTLPQADEAGRINRQGLSANIEISQQFGVGYALVRVQVKSTAGALSSTRRLALRLTPNGQHLPADGALAAEIPFEFEQGQAQVQFTTSIPKWTLGNRFLVALAEDDVILEDHVAEIGKPFTAQDIRLPDTLLRNDYYQDLLLIDVGSIPPVNPARGSQLITRSIQDVPNDWRTLRDVNTIVIAYDALIAAKESDAFETLRYWTLAGGTLVLLDAPAASEIVSELKLSLVESGDDKNRLGGIRYTLDQETNTMIQHYERLLATLQEGAPRAMSDPSIRAITAAPSPMAERLEVEDALRQLREESVAFQTRWGSVMPYTVGVGYVLPISAADMNSRGAVQTLQAFSGFRNSAMLHRGVDPVLGDARHRRWLIPGVAQPPVYAFMGALTLFVILVGPVAYRLTSKAERAHLMFLIAPTLALLTTVAMFSYSVVSDGFGTTTRIRQVTWIDGASGDAFERTRATLFSGISPASGVQFPAGAEVMLYRASDQREWSDLPREVRDVRYRATITQESQRFDSTVLPSRAQRQFVSHLVRPNLGGVSLKDVPEFETGAKTPPSGDATMVSTLPFELESFIARSSDGRYWFAERAAGDAETKVKWLSDLTKASKRLGDLYNLHRLVSTTAATRSGRSRRTVSDLVVYVNRQINRQTAPITDGTLELLLNEMLFVDQELPPGTFVAIATPSQDAVAVQNAQVVASVRYVMGTLK